jgi:hypothetical protein
MVMCCSSVMYVLPLPISRIAFVSASKPFVRRRARLRHAEQVWLSGRIVPTRGRGGSVVLSLVDDPAANPSSS